MKQRFIALLMAALFAGVFNSCDYLDVSDEEAGGLTSFELVFENVNYTLRWYGGIFESMPTTSRVWNENGMGGIWIGYADECFVRLCSNAGKYTDWSSLNTVSDRWGELYERIRQANIFMEMAKPIIDDSSPNADRITEAEMRVYHANARFMRAAYHYWLMEMYGPVPIVDKSYDLQDDLIIERASLDELIEWLDTEFLEAMEDMMQEPNHATANQNYRAVPTKGAALAMRAKMWMYAASPLFNGGFTEALSLANSDGTRLFPAADQGKWQKALAACRDFINYAESGPRYELYVAESGDPEDSLYELFQEYNSEMIWANSREVWGSVASDSYAFDRYSTPRSEPNGMGAIAPLQEFVDDFYMADGYPITATDYLPVASSTYSETGFGDLDGIQVSNMYINREPRFYNTITFSGKRWHISNQEVQFYKGGNAGKEGVDGWPWTGYLLYKRYNRTVHGSNAGVNYKYRPSIIFRLAEFYLLYAEALNEVNPSDPNVLVYLNKVRNRAGLPDIETINPAIAGNKDLQRAAIQRESRLELATEGQRYFDVRRWMIAETAEGRQGGAFHGMNMDGDKETFHTRVFQHNRYFARKNYLYPIPLNETKRNPALVQNPGW